MSRMDKLSSYKTVIFTDADNMQTVVYHSTPIVKWNDEKVILNSGGYKTVTTKRKMEQTRRQFNLPYNVYQLDFIWFVDTLTGKHEFKDNMEINRQTGEVTYV